jgi:hypothetical protein
MAALTMQERDALPSSAFGLPATREYPMPDASHARLALRDVGFALAHGKISAADHERVVQKARAVIAANKRRPVDPMAGRRQ